LNAVLGTKLSRVKVRDCLEHLGIPVRVRGKDALGATPPSYRVDLGREIDLIEEVARMEGYGSIGPVRPSGAVLDVRGDSRAAGRERVRELLCSLGFSESICLSFMGIAEMDRLMWAKDEPLRRAVRLKNPVSEEFAYLRTSMLPPLMRCLSLNANRGNADMRLFEMGTVFSPGTDGEPPIESEKLVLAAMGLNGSRSWCSRAIEMDFFYLKGILENMLAGTGLSLSVVSAVLPSCQPGRSAMLYQNGLPWGWIGEIHPRVADAYGIQTSAILAEVDPLPLYAALLRDPVYRPLPRFPAVKRDVAFVADENLEAAGILETVRGAVPELMETVELFDLFKGEQIPAGKKGLAIAVTLRAGEATLHEGEIETAMGKIREALKSKGCELR
jgi:phenylalanyl-tRNA synthetase beta chain